MNLIQRLPEESFTVWSLYEIGVTHVFTSRRNTAFHLYVIALSLQKHGGGGLTAFKIERFAGRDWILALYKVI